MADFSEARAADQLNKLSTVKLAPLAPKGFFIEGSFLVSGKLLKLDVQDGVLRLDLLSHKVWDMAEIIALMDEVAKPE